jgi:sarcosine oxidase
MPLICDSVVIGAGCFGAWAAHWLRRAGDRVLLVDQYGPGNARASSGGESRIIRMGYGPDAVYTRMSHRSMELWRELFARARSPELFHNTGMLWLAAADDEYTAASERTLREVGIVSEHLSLTDLQRRFPQITVADLAWALFEPQSGVLMARRAVDAVVQDAIAAGVEYRDCAITPPRSKNGKLNSVVIAQGETVSAVRFVFCCGPWLPKIFPDMIAPRMFVTRQEVLFFGVPAGEPRFRPPAMPAWLHHGDQIYGMPDLENRGFKVAFDTHGPAFDPDSSDRTVSAGSAERGREYLARRFPALRNAPLVEARVCQYENSSNGDFIIDRHPELDNVWIAGGGSGHGFKHGPAVGEYLAGLISGSAQIEPRFSITSKATTQHRAVY